MGFPFSLGFGVTNVLPPFFPVPFLVEFVGMGGLLFNRVLPLVMLVFFVGHSLGGLDEPRILFWLVESVGLPVPATTEEFSWFLRRWDWLDTGPFDTDLDFLDLFCAMSGVEFGVEFGVECIWARKLVRAPLPLLLAAKVSFTSSGVRTKSSKPVAAVLLGVQSLLSLVGVGTIVGWESRSCGKDSGVISPGVKDRLSDVGSDETKMLSWLHPPWTPVWKVN